MKLIENTYKHNADGFEIKVTTCNKKIATTERIDTGEIVKFNRSKLEWMINKGVFTLVEDVESEVDQIVKEIKAENDELEEGVTISQESSNEKIMEILAKHDLADDAQEIVNRFGEDGLDRIREAEGGLC